MENNDEDWCRMSISGFIIGVIALFGFIVPVAIFDYVLWLDWINISFAIIGFIISFAGVIQGSFRYFGVTGLILNGVIIVLSALRLF